MRIATLMTILAAPVALAACGSAEDRSDRGADMGDMTMDQSGDTPQTATAEGTVNAIDAEAGTITIAHGPVPAIGWPSMIMPFDADAKTLAGLAAGDEISFEFSTGPEGSVVTSITKK